MSKKKRIMSDTIDITQDCYKVHASFQPQPVLITLHQDGSYNISDNENSKLPFVLYELNGDIIISPDIRKEDKSLTYENKFTDILIQFKSDSPDSVEQTAVHIPLKHQCSTIKIEIITI